MSSEIKQNEKLRQRYIDTTFGVFCLAALGLFFRFTIAVVSYQRALVVVLLSSRGQSVQEEEETLGKTAHAALAANEFAQVMTKIKSRLFGHACW